MIPVADIEIRTRLSVDEDVIRSRQRLMEETRASDYLDLFDHPIKDRPLIIAGGGPSLEDTFAPEAWRHMDVMALNGTAKWLMERDLDPQWHVMIDGRQRVVDYVPDRCPPGLVTLAASCSHPQMWRALKDRPFRMFNTFSGDKIPAVGGGPTVGLRAIVLGHILGYRTILLHGYDSSSRGPTGPEQTLHVYGDRPDHEVNEVVHVHGIPFYTNGDLIQQAQHFYPTVQLVQRDGTDVFIQGGGMLPTMVQGDADPSSLWGLS